MILRAMKVLTSKDKLVSDIAWDQLRSTIIKRTGHTPQSSDDITAFLNALPPHNEAAQGDVRSLWSMVRRSLHYLGIEYEMVTSL